MNSTVKDYYMYLLGGLVVLSSAVITWVLIHNAIPNESHDIIVLAVGQLFTLAGMVVGYFFGSSKSSAEKTDALKDVVTKLTEQK